MVVCPSLGLICLIGLAAAAAAAAWLGPRLDELMRRV